ncbi:TrkA family potassium uptake protein [Trebonia sp.]|uniref:potassium channel family protein n=1 Tax=Trebonia sp. TaxID=2767075 RepID=UPI00261F0687|nr:potassium channel family protein [Trebonia sp.]
MITILLRVFGVPHRRHVANLLGAAVAVVVLGAGLFSLAESLPFTTSLYWAVTTATTVGYGDITPHNPIGRLIASLVMLTTIPMLAAAFALVSGAAAAAGVRRVLAMHTQFPAGTYRLVVGMNATVPAILQELAGAGIPVVLAADVDPAAVRGGVHVVRGDPTEEDTIRRARPAGAEQALITGKSDGDVLVSAVLLRKQAPSLTVTALVSSPSVREALRDLGVRQTVSASELLSRTLAASLETPHAGEMISQLIGNRDALAEIEAAGTAVGKRLSAIRNERAGLVLGLVRGGEFTLGIAEDPVVAAGDRLLVAEATGHA